MPHTFSLRVVVLRSIVVTIAAILIIASAGFTLADSDPVYALFGHNSGDLQDSHRDTEAAAILLTPGTCDTAGPIEVEGSIIGTTPTAYATLAAGFAAINAGTHTGAITIDVCGNTTEPAAGAILNASGSGSASYTSIAMSPVGSTSRSITGAATAGQPLINFNGADNVTVDGLNTGGNSLTITNTTVATTTGTSTIRFINGATNNTITNCSLQGSKSSSVATNGAVIFFSTDSATANGNDNNTISNNDIGPSGVDLPTTGIQCNGSTTTTAIGNSGLVINNNNIFDYFGAAVTSAGIAVNGGCNTFSITNNRFYQTGTRTWTSSAEHNAILLNNTSINSGVQGMTVTGNTIGYASSTQTGIYTLTGASSAFRAIRFNGITTGAVSNINSNTIASVTLAGVVSAGVGVNSPFAGIIINNGLVNTNGNTIGSQSATGSLTFSTTTTVATDVYGMYNFGIDDWTANSNNIGGISVTNAAASGTLKIYGLRADTTTTRAFNASLNNVGGTVANSIQLTATGTGSQVVGLATQNAAGNWITNTVRNMTTNIGTGTDVSASMIGMLLNSTSTNHSLSQNTTHTLTNTNTTGASVVTGIQSTGGSANIVERNLIYNLTAPTTSASAEINGIRVGGGTTTYRNNMIALGANQAIAIGGAATNSSTSGINGFSGFLGTDNVFHNSIFIGGTATSGSGASYAFNGTQVTSTRSFRNNVFHNARTNSGATGKHYAIKINGTSPNPTGLTINNNVYFANGASGGVFGFFNGSDVANLLGWGTAVGQDTGSLEGDPQYNAPTNVIPDLHIHPTNPTVVEGEGEDVGVIDDFDGHTRTGLSPIDIGADAGNFIGVFSTPTSTNTPTATHTSTATHTPTPTPNPTCIPPASGKVLWHKAEGDTTDSSGNNNNGTLQNGAAFAAGKVGQAYSFNAGSGAYVGVPDSASLDVTTQFTLDAWINPSSLMQDGQTGGIISKVGGAAGDNGYQFIITGNNAQLRCIFNAQGEPWPLNSLLVTVPGGVPLNTWSHAACTYDNADIKIYFNGALIGTQNVGPKTVVNSAAPLRISSDENNNVDFDGKIDEPEVYNRALSATEIAAIFNAGGSGQCGCTPSASGMFAWYKGEGNANDSIGSNHGTLENGATFSAGQVGQAFSFDGNDDRIVIPHAANQNAGSNITIAAWIKETTLAHGRPIVQKRTSGNVGGYTFETVHSPFGPDGSLQWVIMIGGVYQTAATPANVLQAGVWQHVAATYDGAFMKIYVNGIEVASRAQTGSVDNSTEPLVVGRNVVFNNPFHGNIDELQFYDRALTAGEIAGIHGAGSGGTCGGNCPPGGSTFSDAFSNGLDPAYWSVIQTTPGLFSVDTSQGDVRLAKTAMTSPGGIQNVTVQLNLAALGGPIAGDFSTQIDFSNAVIGPGIDQIELHTVFADNSFMFDVYDNSCANPNVHIWNGSLQGCTPTAATGGTFKISRVGSTLSGHFNNIQLFAQSSSSPLTRLEFVLQLQPGSNDMTSVTFDNFSLTGGTCGCPIASPVNKVSWWRGEGNPSDSVGANNGTLVGGTTYTTGRVGQAFSLNGTNAGVTVPHNTNLDINPGGFSSEFWMKSNAAPSGQVLLVDKSHGWTDSTGWAFQSNPPGNRIAWFIGGGGGGSTNFVGVESTVNPFDGNFHHVAGTWDGTNIRLYIDGVLQGTAPFSTPVNNTRAVNIGYSWGGGSPLRFFNGLVDEVAIYARALTETEIQGAAGRCVSAISGTVIYGNALGNPAPPRFVSNVLITGAGSPTVMTTTGAPGATAGGFGSGSYTVTPTKTGGVNGAISSFDAGRIALHVAGPPNPQLTATQLIVADVSGNSSVTSFDAGMIAKFVAGQPHAPPGIGATGTWRFAPVNRNYASITSSISGEDYVALLMGEVSGNWANSGARPVRTVNSGQSTVNSEDGGDELPRKSKTMRQPPLSYSVGELSGPVRGIAVEVPSISVSVGKEIVVPVNVQGIADKNVISYEFVLRYDPSVIQPMGDLVDIKDTASRDLSVVTNASEPGLLRVVVYGAFPIIEDGALLNLRFTAVGAAGSASPLTFERIMFNEGEPRVWVTNGKIRLSE